MQPPDSLAYNAGTITGQLIFCLLLVLGIYKAITICRRPHANFKCVFSLVMMLVSWLIAGALGALQRAAPGQVWLSLMVGLTMFSAVVASTVLAIIGLVEYARNRDLYTQGRAQAITSLVLSGLFALAMVVGFAVGYQRNAGKMRPLALGADPKQSLVNNTFNFKFNTPPWPWVQLDARKMHPNATLMFAQSNRFFCMILAEQDIVLDNETESLVEIVKSNSKSVAGRLGNITEKKEIQNTLAGVRLEMDASVRNIDLFYSQWICATNGYAYQIHCWGSLRDRERVRQVGQEMSARFALADPQRVSPAMTRMVVNVESTNFPYRVDLQGTAWKIWTDFKKDVPLADFGAVHPKGIGLIVVPLPVETTPSEATALTHALLQSVTIAFPKEDVEDAGAIFASGGDGREYRHSRVINGNHFDYRLRVLRSPGMAWLVAGWHRDTSQDSATILTDALDRVQIGTSSNMNLASLPASKAQPVSVMLNSIGLQHYELSNFERAAHWFKEAARTSPTNSMYVANVAEAYSMLERHDDALKYLNEFDSTEPSLMAVRASLQAQLNQIPAALSNYERLFSGDYQSERHFKKYIDLVRESETAEAALQKLNQHIEKHDTVPVRLLQAELLQSTRDYTNAIGLLTNLQQRVPGNLDVRFALANAFLGAELYRDALDSAKAILRLNPDSGYAQFAKARSEIGLRWYREAKTSLEAASKKLPADKTIKEYLDHVSGLLGEANNLSITRPIKPVVIPSELTSISSANDRNYAEYGAYYLTRVSAISYRQGEELRSTDFFHARVIDAAGVSRFSTIQVPFNPLAEEVFVNSSIVRMGDEKVSEGKLADYYVLDDTSSGVVSQRKIVNIPISGLKPGCNIQVTVTRRDLGSPREFRFIQHPFSSTVPVVQSSLYVTGDVSNLAARVSAKIFPHQTGYSLWWSIDDPQVYRWEPMQSEASEFLPTLWLAGTNTTWQKESRDYLSSIADRRVLEPSQRELVSRLTERCSNAVEKVEAITRHLQQDYSYRAIEFGRRARIPQHTGDFVRSKNGDCKDHAVLLQKMIEQAGVPAYLALVNTVGALQKDMPSLDQFNHMIVYAPSMPNPFLDCTDKGSDIARFLPIGLAERHVLVLDEQSARFVTAPSNLKGTIVLRRTIRLTNQTDAIVMENVSFTGPHAAALRSYLRASQPEIRQQLIENLLDLHGALLAAPRFENIQDTSKPLIVSTTCLLRKQFELINQQIVGKLPARWERRYLGSTAVARRTAPFAINSPLILESNIEIIADGLRPVSVEHFDREFDQKFGACKSTARANGGTVQIKFSGEQRSGRFPASEYSLYHDTMERIVSTLDQSIVFN